MSGFNIFRSSDRPLPNRSTNFNYAIYVPDAGDITPVDFVDQLCGVVAFGACGRQENALYCAVCFQSKVGYHRVCKSVEGIFPDVPDFVVKSPMKLKPLGYIDAIRNDCEVMIVYEEGIIVEGREKDEEQLQEEEGPQLQEEPVLPKEEPIVPTGRKRKRKQDKRLVHRQPPPEEEAFDIDEGLDEYYTAGDRQNVTSFGEDVYPSAEPVEIWKPQQCDQDITEGTKGNTEAQYLLGGKGWIPIAPKSETPDVQDCSLLASANINIGVIQNPDRSRQQTGFYSESDSWSAVGLRDVLLPSNDLHSEGYRCEICGAWFKTLRMRSSHITSCRYKDSLARDGRILDVRQRHLTKTGRGNEDDKEGQPKKEYKCELCGKSFDRLRIRSSHMKSCRDKGDRTSEVWNKQHRGKNRGRKGKKSMKVRELLKELMETKKDGAVDFSKQELEEAVKDNKVELDSEEESQPKTTHSPEKKSTENIAEDVDVQRVTGDTPDKDISVQGNAGSDISEQGNSLRNSTEEGKEQSITGATVEDGDENRSDKTETASESEECDKATMASDQTEEREKLKERDETGQPRVESKLPLKQKNRKLVVGKSGLACPFCPAKFSCKQRYQTHLDSHSIPELPPSEFKCFKCSALFQSSKDLKIHSKIHNREGEHVCAACGAKFRQTQSRDRHLRKFHPEFLRKQKLENKELERRRKLNMIKATSCYLCGKPVADIDEYKMHMKDHRDMKRDVESRPYQCLVCQARYRDAKTIQLHMRNHTGREWEWRLQLSRTDSTQNVAGSSNPSIVQSEREKTAEEKEKDEEKLWKDLEKVVGLDLTKELKKHNLFKPHPKQNNHKVAVVSPYPKPVQKGSIKQLMADMNQPIIPPRSHSSAAQEQKNDSTEEPKVAPPVVTKGDGLQKRKKKRMQLHSIIANLKQSGQGRAEQEGVGASMEQQAGESNGEKEWEKVKIKEEPLDHVTEATPNMASGITEDPKDPNEMMDLEEDVPVATEPNISSFHCMVEKMQNSVPTINAEYSVSNTSPVPKPLEINKELENLDATLKAAIELSKELKPVNEAELVDDGTRESSSSSSSSAKEVKSLGGGVEVKTEPGCDEGPSERQDDSETTTETATNRNEAVGRVTRLGRGGKTRGRRGRRTARNKNVEKDTDYLIPSDSTAPAKSTRGKRRASTSRGSSGKRQRRSPRTPLKMKEPQEVILTKPDRKKSLKKSPILLDLLGKPKDTLDTMDNEICTASSPPENSHTDSSVTVNADVGGNTEMANKVVMIEGIETAGQNAVDQTTVADQTTAVVHQKNCSCCAKSRQTILVGKELHMAFPNKVNMRAMVDQRPFYCNVCGARYSEEATLRMHMRLHPPSSRPTVPLHTNEQGQFICVVCGGKFSEKEELIRHSRIHPLLY
ncbi:ZBTB11 [Branchiostoma lanceolatum]|uniref:ZBTB11 protein n=1 Tax=Branchiostoma lanceolatum TaxID=7740 RepID=A0A8K0EFQ0_BRALA|nr:ZBTB11 [Branchiostoma lanceolatum]